MLASHENQTQISDESLDVRIIENLLTHGYSMADGLEVCEQLLISKQEADELASYWNKLIQDQYMADGGRYRLRRYGEFELKPGDYRPHQLPHGPYVQPAYINHLNGEIERNFEPLEPDFVSNTALQNILVWMAELYKATLGLALTWNIRLHPYRILASDKESGCPTPEGLHRDGVTFIASMMIHRQNISGGITTITDDQGKVLCKTELSQPFDLILGDDEKTMHAVSPIKPRESNQGDAYRDVLVIAFTKEEVQRV